MNNTAIFDNTARDHVRMARFMSFQGLKCSNEYYLYPGGCVTAIKAPRRHNVTFFSYSSRPRRKEFFSRFIFYRLYHMYIYISSDVMVFTFLFILRSNQKKIQRPYFFVLLKDRKTFGMPSLT